MVVRISMILSELNPAMMRTKQKRNNTVCVANDWVDPIQRVDWIESLSRNSVNEVFVLMSGTCIYFEKRLISTILSI